MAGGVQHIDAVIGVARMTEHLLVLLVPGIHRLPLARDMGPQRIVSADAVVAEQVEADVLLREVVDRQPAELVQELDAPAARDRHAREHGAHAPRRVLDVDRVGGRVEVEASCRLVTERPVPRIRDIGSPRLE
jgi:hypothetical protein